MMLTLAEHIAWLGEYSLSGTGLSAFHADRDPEAKAAGAQIIVEASASDGKSFVLAFRLPV